MLEDLIDIWGFQSPFLLNFLVFCWILGGSYGIVVSIFYLGGFFLNNYLNEFLKSWLRIPRPVPFDFARAQRLDPMRFFRADGDKIYISRAHVYGMPSGHAQMSAYGLVFYYFLVERGWGMDWWSPALMLFMGFCFMHALMIYQRWKSREHTIVQLIMGTLVGVCFGWVVYSMMRVSLQMMDGGLSGKKQNHGGRYIRGDSLDYDSLYRIPDELTL